MAEAYYTELRTKRANQAITRADCCENCVIPRLGFFSDTMYCPVKRDDVRKNLKCQHFEMKEK